MNETAYERVIAALRDTVDSVKDNGRQALANCPAHPDQHPSLGVTRIEGSVLINCRSQQCHIEDILAALNLKPADLYDEPSGATYTYTDLRGKPTRHVHRSPSKKFHQSGVTKGIAHLYRLPEVVAAVKAGQPIYLVEGEKDVHALEAIGAVATTSPQGATNWHHVDPSPLTGAHVIIVPDRDQAGYKYAAAAVKTLKPITASVQVKLPAAGEDAADHVAAGHGLGDLTPHDLPAFDEDDTPTEQAPVYAFLLGGNFILDTPATPESLWGAGQEVLFSEGEALIIAGPQGLGKTTLAQQLALGRCGFPDHNELLGYPITPGTQRVLYLAMDRPRQAARSFRRMVTEDQRQYLNELLMVWPGPPPADLAKFPGLLLELCHQAQADTVIVDSLKDAALGLTDDEVGAGYNRARQIAVADGVQVIELHHNRKAHAAMKATLTIDDLYGSVWLPSGAGSVVLLAGAAGDPIVSLHHLKQPAEPVGPLRIIHDHQLGRSMVWHAMDLLQTAKASLYGLTAKAAASALFETEKPGDNELEKARRKLEALTKQGHLRRVDPDASQGRPTTYWPVDRFPFGE